MSLTLVVMAAGLGSRFGGTKQLAQIGSDGEAFLDFAITDATAAGVDKVVLIVRSDIEADVRRHLANHRHDVEIAFVLQDTHGPSRNKPWGTGHAVLTAAPEVDGSFIVINADDYYGRSTYVALAEAAIDLPNDRSLLAGFRLDQTLPEMGEVSRGICGVDGVELVSLVETHGIGRRDDDGITATDPAGPLADDAIASMNCWVFPHRLFGDLESGFAAFLAEYGDEETTEYLLPRIIHRLMASSDMTVGVVPTSESWVGVTNPDDLEVARRRIAEVRD
ncbi:MAG: NTP transferase domain-containing protein [Acidimicrobiaceae bacterium]|nr:NTP transferase domain-containing protein [Acidimicrobiaceae bacterium]